MLDPAEPFYLLDNHHCVSAELLFDGQEEQKQLFINSQTLAKVNQERHQKQGYVLSYE